MRRREFILVWAQAAIALPLRVRARESDTLPRVGVLVQGGPHYAGLAGLREGLGALGIEDGKQAQLIVRETKGDLKAAGAAAAELEREGVAVVVSFSMSVTLSVKRATSTVPIVYTGGTDPVADGLVESVSRPGGRVTGVHHLVAELTGKRLELFRELVPTLKRAVTFYNPNNPAARQAIVSARDAARALTIELVERQVSSPAEVRQQADELKSIAADGFFLIGDATIGGQDQVIIDAANRLRLPTMAPEADRVVRGALAAYGVNYRDLGRATAPFVRSILAGSSPGDLPIEMMTKPSLAINLRTANTIGLTVPSAVLARADELIE